MSAATSGPSTAINGSHEPLTVGSSYRVRQPCPVDDFAEPAVVGIAIPPGDVAADHAGLLGVAGVVGAVQS
jgi:hypothetical protein